MDPRRLAAFPLFTGVEPDELAALGAAATERTVRSGEVVLHDGDFGYTGLLVEEGTAEVVKDGEVVGRLAPGDVVGEIAVERSGRRTADVRAVTDLRLVVILNRDLWKVERRLPQVAERLRAIAAQRAVSFPSVRPDHGVDDASQPIPPT